MNRILKTERCKLKHSCIWLAVLGIPLIPAFLGSANYAGNTGILTSQWSPCFTATFSFRLLLGSTAPTSSVWSI